MNSALPPLSKPSAIFEVIEIADFLICSFHVKSLLNRPEFVAEYIILTKDLDSLHIGISSNFE